MSDSEVKVYKDNGSKFQWAKGLFYRKEGKKLRLKPKVLKIGSVAIFILVTATSGYFAPETTRYDDSAIDPEISHTDSDKVTILNYLDTVKKESRDKVEAQQRAWRRQAKSVKVAKLTVVSRAGIDKIPPGSEVEAILLTGATDGTIKARLKDDLEAAGELFLPEGTTLIGLGASGDDRLAIGFHTAVFEDGTTQKISAVVYDIQTKIIGLAGPKLGRRAIKMAMSTGLHFVAGVSQGLQEVEVKDGVAVQKSSLKNALLQGAGLAAVEQSKEMMEELKDKQAQIFVKAGTSILVVFQEAGQ